MSRLRQAFAPSPGWLLAAALLLVHQVVQRGLGVELPVVDDYLDPVLAVPVLVGLAHAERRWLLGARWGGFQTWELLGITLAIAVVGEELFPRLDPLRQTRDPWDYPAYALGGLLTGIAYFRPIKRPVTLAVALACALTLAAQAPEYRPGDFLFQDLDCGPLCDAIESVTPALDGRHFSHVGLVAAVGDSLYVYEAVSRGGVVRTPLRRFAERLGEDSGGLVHMRLTPKHQALIPAALDYCARQLGTPYDEVYLLGNGHYYCSELLYAAFAHANAGRPVFALHPMTFKDPGADTFNVAWRAYYEALGFAIPEGELGCNPGGLATGGLLERVR